MCHRPSPLRFGPGHIQLFWHKKSQAALQVGGPAHSEQVHEASDIAVDVGTRVLHHIPHAGQSSEVHCKSESDSFE